MLEYLLVITFIGKTSAPAASSLAQAFPSRAECDAAGAALKTALPQEKRDEAVFVCVERTASADRPTLSLPSRLAGKWEAASAAGTMEMWDIKVEGRKVSGGFVFWNPLCTQRDTFSGVIDGSTIRFEQDKYCGFAGTMAPAKDGNGEFIGAGTFQGFAINFRMRPAS